MTATLDRINEMTIAHERDMRAFHRDQSGQLAEVLREVIEALGVEPMHGERTPGERILFGAYRVSDIIAAASRRAP